MKKNDNKKQGGVRINENKSAPEVNQNLRMLAKTLWVTPVIASVLLPIHAQVSTPPDGTTTTSPDGTTTTPPDGTTTTPPDGTTTTPPDGTTTTPPDGTTTTTTTTTTTASPGCPMPAATITPPGMTGGCPASTNIFTSEILIGSGCAPGGQVTVSWDCPMSNPNSPMVTVNPDGTWGLRAPYPGRPGECCTLVIVIDGVEFTRVSYMAAPGAP